MRPPRPSKQRKRTRSKYVLQELIVKNPFDTWIRDNKIDLNKLALLSGIRAYRLRALQTGLIMPWPHEIIQLERVSGATLPLTAWLEVPVVQTALKGLEANVGVKPNAWATARFNGALWMQESVYDTLETLFERWGAARDQEDAEQAAKRGTENEMP